MRLVIAALALSILPGVAFADDELTPQQFKESREHYQTGAAHNNIAVIYMMDGRFDEAKRSVLWAEEAGFRVDPRFKEDLEERAAAAQ